MNFDNDSDSDNDNDSDNNDTTTMKTKNNNSNINDISTIFSPTTTKNYKTVAETNRLGLLLAAKIDELTNERNEWHQQYDNIKSKYDHSIKENGILKLQIKGNTIYIVISIIIIIIVHFIKLFKKNMKKLKILIIIVINILMKCMIVIKMMLINCGTTVVT